MAQKLHTSAERVAKSLLDIGAVTFASNTPFTWTSGLRAPIYCDNRLVLSYPRERRVIADAFVDRLEGLSPEAVVGVATAGIPHAAWLAERMSLPMAYVRAKAKEHGRRNQLEGHLVKGCRTVVVEDLISTGMSSLRAVEVVRDVTSEAPLAVLAIFTYNFRDVAAQFAANGTSLYALTNFDTLTQVALEMRLIRASDLDALMAWQQDPHAWAARYAS